jgi:hypothetical protein
MVSGLRLCTCTCTNPVEPNGDLTLGDAMGYCQAGARGWDVGEREDTVMSVVGIINLVK